MVAAILIALRLSPANGTLWGAGAFLLYSFGSRGLIARDHRAGIALVKRQQFESAIPHFQRSLEFLDRHPWIDRFRSIVLMSASAISYREMALANTAFCYSQVGNGEEARRYYKRCLERVRNSGLASAALRLMDSGAQEARRITPP
jgi:tetratricopeptide (TPR) repeat protein